MSLFHTMQQLQRVLRNGLWHSVLFASICWDGLLSSAKLMIEQIWLCSEIQLQNTSLFVSNVHIYISLSLFTFSVSTPTVQNHRNQKEGTGLRFGLDTNPCKIFKLSMICVSRTSSSLKMSQLSLWIWIHDAARWAPVAVELVQTIQHFFTDSLTRSQNCLLVKNGPKQIADSSRWIFAGASIAMRQIATSYSLCTKSKAQWYFVVLLKHIARLLCSPAVRINNRLCDRMLLSSHCLGKLLVSHTAFGCGSHLRQSGCTICYGDRARWKPKAKISKEEIHEEKYPHRIIIVSSYESYCSIIQNGRRSCSHV